MKKLKLANLAKGLNRNEMKSIIGGGPVGPGNCQGQWVPCLCGGPTGAFICWHCQTPDMGQC